MSFNGEFLLVDPSHRPPFPRGLKKETDEIVVYPPNGVLPMKNMSYYVAPLCYLFGDSASIYSVFREMYTRYFFRLHTISSHPESILRLSLEFERLMQAHQPLLFLHLRVREWDLKNLICSA